MRGQHGPTFGYGLGFQTPEFLSIVVSIQVQQSATPLQIGRRKTLRQAPAQLVTRCRCFGMWRRQAALALNGTAGVQASGRGPSSYTAQLPTPTGRSVQQGAHPVDMVFGRFCSLVPIYVLGLGGPVGTEGSMVPVVVTLIGTVWGFFIHANIRCRFGPLEWLISTPAFHHWHHTLKGPINRNYSVTLPWVDCIFGTYYLPNRMPEAYGITAGLPGSLIGQLAYPLLSPLSLPVARTRHVISEADRTGSSVARSQEDL